MVYNGKSHWFGSTSILGNHCIYNYIYIYIIIHICISVYIYIYICRYTWNTSPNYIVPMTDSPDSLILRTFFTWSFQCFAHIYIYYCFYELQRNGGFLYPFFQLFSILPYGSTCCHLRVWFKHGENRLPPLPLGVTVFVWSLCCFWGVDTHLLFFDRFWGFHFIGCQVPQTWHTCRCVSRDLWIFVGKRLEQESCQMQTPHHWACHPSPSMLIHSFISKPKFIRDSKIRRTAVKNKTSFNRESASTSFSSYQALAKAIRSWACHVTSSSCA